MRQYASIDGANAPSRPQQTNIPPKNRPENRPENRRENRPENRPKNRRENRPENRRENRPENRPENDRPKSAIRIHSQSVQISALQSRDREQDAVIAESADKNLRFR